MRTVTLTVNVLYTCILHIHLSHVPHPFFPHTAHQEKGKSEICSDSPLFPNQCQPRVRLCGVESPPREMMPLLTGIMISETPRDGR